MFLRPARAGGGQEDLLELLLRWLAEEVQAHLVDRLQEFLLLLAVQVLQVVCEEWVSGDGLELEV